MERDELITVYSDLFKDVYGSRPRGMGNLSNEDLARRIDYLQKELDDIL